jgi:hypothetical protein
MEEEKFRIPEDMFPTSMVYQFEKAELFVESAFNKTKLVRKLSIILISYFFVGLFLRE